MQTIERKLHPKGPVFSIPVVSLTGRYCFGSGMDMMAHRTVAADGAMFGFAEPVLGTVYTVHYPTQNTPVFEPNHQKGRFYDLSQPLS